jgi:hypothetical protein
VRAALNLRVSTCASRTPRAHRILPRVSDDTSPEPAPIAVLTRVTSQNGREKYGHAGPSIRIIAYTEFTQTCERQTSVVAQETISGILKHYCSSQRFNCPRVVHCSEQFG